MQKYSLDDINKICESKGGKCLSEKYTSKKMKFICARGHEWESVPWNILSGCWCQKCFGIDIASNNHHTKQATHTIQELKEIAVSKGGECLSDEYKNTTSKYKFRCKEGHEWETEAASIFRGNWCRECQYESMRRSQYKNHTVVKIDGDITAAKACKALQCDPTVEYFNNNIYSLNIPNILLYKDNIVKNIRSINKLMFRHNPPLFRKKGIIVSLAIYLALLNTVNEITQDKLETILDCSAVSLRSLMKALTDNNSSYEKLIKMISFV